jgi:type II secretory pathway component PulM
MNIQLAVKLLPYIGLGISLILFLGLFYGLSRMIGKLSSRVATLEAQCQQALELSTAVKGLTRRIEERETGNSANETPSRTAGSLNGTVRSKVLKMHRLGQSAERIADNLRVPQGEVDLLVKVHQIVMRPYEQVSTGAGEAEAS